MVAIPTLEEEDARRPSRERESLIGERTRIINRMKAGLIRLGIRGFKPELLKAPQRLEAQHTAEGVPIPPNMLDELRRDMARLAWVREQINAIEQARLERLEQAPYRSEEHTSELQSHLNLVCRLLLEKKKRAGKTGTT